MIFSEPFRLFFPAGIVSLLAGALLWLPQIWSADHYPVLLHRYLVLNGFVSFFVGGFLMTAVPRFSKTDHAGKGEVFFYLIVSLAGLIPALGDNERLVHLFSASQSFILLFFIFTRIYKRRENPPYSFIFIFVGIFLWIFSSLAGVFNDFQSYKEIHYEGAIASIILGVGSRLIPGILGHVEIVKAQREAYERPAPILSTVPWYFFLFVGSFSVSYFVPETIAGSIRAVIVAFVGFIFWRLHKIPLITSALTWCIWVTGWLIVASFALKALWPDGLIHANHAFFLNGIVLLSLLIATRVIQSHGPKLKELENWRGLYVVTGIILLASATRVTAVLLPEVYLTHLGYSSFVMVVGVLIWSIKYLKYVR